MEAPPPMLGVAVEPPQARPQPAPLPVVPMAPVLAPVAPPWPRSAQAATAALLVLALGLLGWHAWGGLRWGSRPTTPGAEPDAPGRIDLNHADRAELLQLPGVGDAAAERIEEYRLAHNGFRRVDDLRQVRGVGPALMERLRPLIDIEPDEAMDDGGDDAAPGVRKDAPAKADKPAGKKTTPAAPVNVNTASVEELQQLPGIGPALSGRILRTREQRPFRSVDDLRHVPGIGPKTLERLRPFVKVGG